MRHESTTDGARGAAARRTRSRLGGRLRDEAGIALVAAIGTLTALAIACATTITLATAGARQAKSSNAGQASYALAEAGLNNAVAVLNAAYATSTTFPGDASLLPERTTQLPGGSVKWSGTLTATAGGAWPWEWRLTSRASVADPSRAGGTTTRTLQAVVPVTSTPATTQVGQTSPLNWIYALNDITFEQSLTVGSPIYAGRNLTLDNTASVLGTAGTVAVGGVLTLSKTNNWAGSSTSRLSAAHVYGGCASFHTSLTTHACSWDADGVYATARDTLSPATLGLIDPVPKLTCCAPVLGTVAPAAAAGATSEMGRWYRDAQPGPLTPCDPATRTGTPPTFDTGDGTINNSATPSTPVNLTPSSSYTCKVVRNGATVGELSWNATTRVLTGSGTIFIDGSATIDTGGAIATYRGVMTIYLTGTFGMQNGKICAVASGTDCNFTTWDPNANALAIVADGDGGGGGAQAQASNLVPAGDGILLKTASFQGILIANKGIETKTTAKEQGPMISVYGSVKAGQSGTLSFPAIHLAPSGLNGVTQTPAGAALLSPRSFSG
jgi:hypothetical protein